MYYALEFHMSVLSFTFHFILNCLRILDTLLFIYEEQKNSPYVQNIEKRNAYLTD